MDSQLFQHINEFGGKHGGLLFAKEKGIPIPPMHVWKNGNDPDFGAISKICSEAANRTGKIIIRTSVPDDWKGIIDQMPTKSYSSLGLIKDCNLETTLRSHIDEMRTSMEEDEIHVREHAKLEGTSYNVADVTFSVAPYYGNITAMGTEHPNFTEGLLVDVRENDSNTFDEHFRNDLFRGIRVDDPEWGHQPFDRGTLNRVERLRESARKIQDAIRNLGINDDVAYQFEFGWDEVLGQAVLFQIREFTQKHPLVLEKNTVPNLRYFMGNNGDPITLPIDKKKYLDEFEKKDHSYAAYIRNGFGQYRQWGLGNNAAGIITTVQSCLSHILAQPTISSMKRRGFALLNVQLDDNCKSLDPEKPVTVFHDSNKGIQWEQC